MTRSSCAPAVLRFVAFTGVILLVAGVCTAAPPDTLRVLCAAEQPGPIRQAVAAFVGQEKTLVEVTTSNKVDAPDVYATKGPFDVIIAPCNRTAKKWQDGALVVAGSERSLYWKRMSIVLPLGNPKGILQPADVSRPDLCIAVQTLCVGRVDETLANLKPNVVLQAQDGALLVRLLRQGDLDAIITFDTAVADYADSLVVMRLPRSVCGDLGETPVPIYLAANAPHPEEAKKLIDFLSASPQARKVYLSHALTLSDGVKEAKSYDTGAGKRFDKVYRDLCRQVVDDYKVTRGRALDIGCGPGQMTLELARITQLQVVGLDIEPEVIEIAKRKASQAGLAERASFVAADAHALPFPDNCFDLVISRGTWPFLRDHVLAFREVYRVMKPGAVAFIGGGRGRYTTEEEWASLGERDPRKQWFRAADAQEEGTFFPFPLESYDVLMAKVGIAPRQYKVFLEGGQWVEIHK